MTDLGKGIIEGYITECTSVPFLSYVTYVIEDKAGDDLFITSNNGQLSRISFTGIRVMGRAAAEVQTMGLKDGNIVVSISKNTGDAEDVQ